MATAKATREAVADAVREVVPEGWAVYAWPHVTQTLPCVVVEPRAPYQERGTFRGRGLNLRLTVLHQVAAGEHGGSVVDALLDDLLPRLDGLSDIRWTQVASVGDASDRAGVMAVGASIDLAAMNIT